MRILLVGNYPLDRQQSMLRFADSLHAGLRAQGVEAELIRPEPTLGKLCPGSRGLGKWLGYVDKLLLFPRILKRRAAEFDLVHICDHSNAFYTACLNGIAHLVTCNDLLAIRSARGEFPQNPTRTSGRLLQRLILRGLNRAQAITCISEATRKDVLRLTNHPAQKVSVTYMGLNYPYRPDFVAASCDRRNDEREESDSRKPPLQAEARQQSSSQVSERYLLHVGGDQWYKNRPGVLAIYRELRAILGHGAPRLVMVGPRLEVLPPGVESLSEVDNASLGRLYSGAELLLFPSLEEGFGWPIIEAQACGCRVVTTGKAPMSEIGGESPFYLGDPSDTPSCARVVAEALAEAAPDREKRIAAGLANAERFSTEKMVGEYVSLYRAIASADTARKKPLPPKDAARREPRTPNL
jgi:glycosyltransferase involved in cell wall biosynthesis